MFEGQIDRMGDREDLPKEILFESEQELLKRIHEIKNELKESEWSESPPPQVTQPSFLRTDLGEEELSLKFGGKSFLLPPSIGYDSYTK